MGLGDLFVSRSRRTFHVSDDVNRARGVVNGMTLDDGAPNGLPPGVFGRQSGPGHFNAVSPFAGFDSRFETRSDGRGGSYVTENNERRTFVAACSDEHREHGNDSERKTRERVHEREHVNPPGLLAE